jgi:hypothetical protein
LSAANATANATANAHFHFAETALSQQQKCQKWKTRMKLPPLHNGQGPFLTKDS